MASWVYIVVTEREPHSQWEDTGPSGGAECVVISVVNSRDTACALKVVTVTVATVG